MLHFSSVSDSDRMLEAGTIRARAITTRWNVFTSRRRRRPHRPVLLALCCRARIRSLEMSSFFSAAWFKPSWWRWRIADHHYSFAIQGILICALLSGERRKEKKKKRSTSDFIFWKKSGGLEMFGSWWARASRTSFFPFFFFCTNISNCWLPRSACTAFCVIMCNTVEQNKTGTKKCTFIMIHHTGQICGQAFGPGGGRCGSLTCQITI